jgi:hypothetical protein
MADLETFREETRRWLVANAPDLMSTPPGDDDICWGGRKGQYPPDVKRWLDVCAERGFTAPTWPTEYGGGGLSNAEAKVLSEEMRKLRLRPPLVGFGLTMIGPLLLQEGSEALKREHLPKITRGEIRWCQGYSEPGSGSDLASLQTKAVRDGDVFVLNGQKGWTSYADRADWMFILVRTDFEAPKHLGITFLLMDMDAPGVSVQPIDHAEFVGGAARNVDDPPLDERPAIVDADHHRTLRAHVRDAHFGTERQRPVRGRHGTGLKPLAARGLGALAVKRRMAARLRVCRGEAGASCDGGGNNQNADCRTHHLLRFEPRRLIAFE